MASLSGERTRRGSGLSVVIPALNEERYLGSLLSDISRQTLPPEQVIVVDAGSNDATVAVARGFAFVEVLSGSPPTPRGRNLGGCAATGECLIFLDADVRLSEVFFEDFLSEFERRALELACPRYVPYRSTPAVRAIHTFFNALLRAFEGVLPSGAGHCILLRREVFVRSGGFDPALKFDDVELIRRVAKDHRFGIVGKEIFVSDRRYREQGVIKTSAQLLIMSLLFALGRFRWANCLDYEFGNHSR